MFESLTRFIPQCELAEGFGVWVVNREHTGAPDDPILFPYVAYGQLVTGVEDSIAAFMADHPELELTRYGKILEESGLAWTLRPWRARTLRLLMDELPWHCWWARSGQSDSVTAPFSGSLSLAALSAGFEGYGRSMSR